MAWIAVVPPSPATATRGQLVSRREVWLLREQLDRLVEAVDPALRDLLTSM